MLSLSTMSGHNLPRQDNILSVRYVDGTGANQNCTPIKKKILLLNYYKGLFHVI